MKWDRAIVVEIIKVIGLVLVAAIGAFAMLYKGSSTEAKAPGDTHINVKRDFTGDSISGNGRKIINNYGPVIQQVV
jgi:flagellar basal body-associated protein FliL